MARPRRKEVAGHLRAFARDLRAAIKPVDPLSAVGIDVDEIAADAESLAASFFGNELAPVEAAEELFRLTDRVQDVWTAMEKVNGRVQRQLQIAMHNLRTFIITQRVIERPNGVHEWAE
jgi:hypothetical protein